MFEATGNEVNLYEYVYNLNHDCQIVCNLPNHLMTFTNTFVSNKKVKPKYQDYLNELAQNCNIPLPEAKAYINDMANMGYIEI